MFFVDAAHFVLAPFFGFLWAVARIFIRTPHDRQRVNVLGAVDAISKQIVTICNETYVNSETVNALLDRLAHMTDLPITLVLDNARYQRCNFVMEHARKLGIELLFLPSYSPNLNLIERLWKLVKKKCLYNRYYSQFSVFREAILTCLAKLNTDSQPELESLLTLEFQDIRKIKLSA